MACFTVIMILSSIVEKPCLVKMHCGYLSQKHIFNFPKPWYVHDKNALSSVCYCHKFLVTQPFMCCHVSDVCTSKLKV